VKVLAGLGTRYKELSVGRVSKSSGKLIVYLGVLALGTILPARLSFAQG